VEDVFILIYLFSPFQQENYLIFNFQNFSQILGLTF